MRKLTWNKADYIGEPEEIIPPVPVVVPEVVSPVQTTVVQVKRRNRVGNGHKKEKIRELYDGERKWLKNAFVRKNGQIENDDCVIFRGQMPFDVQSIFQITGYISVLHRYVAQGKLFLRDLEAYKAWMQAKYSGLLAQFNSPENVEARSLVVSDSSGSMSQPPRLSTEPAFKMFPKRRSYFCPA